MGGTQQKDRDESNQSQSDLNRETAADQQEGDLQDSGQTGTPTGTTQDSTQQGVRD